MGHGHHLEAGGAGGVEGVRPRPAIWYDNCNQSPRYYLETDGHRSSKPNRKIKERQREKKKKKRNSSKDAKNPVGDETPLSSTVQLARAGICVMRKGKPHTIPRVPIAIADIMRARCLRSAASFVA